MELFKTIFKRRSVRSFLKNSLLESELNDIKKYLDSIKQIGGQNATFKFVTSSDVTTNIAPHYILAYSKFTLSEYINIGYVLEELDLYLQSIGLGSLWLGMASPKGGLGGEDYAIMLAFGKTDIPMRENVDEFKRLKVLDIANIYNEVTRAARLAPSAVNSQPWQITYKIDKVVIDYKGRGVLKAVLKPKKSKIDLGIVTKFIELALENEGKKITDINIKEINNNPRIEVFYK